MRKTGTAEGGETKRKSVMRKIARAEEGENGGEKDTGRSRGRREGNSREEPQKEERYTAISGVASRTPQAVGETPHHKNAPDASKTHSINKKLPRLQFIYDIR